MSAKPKGRRRDLEKEMRNADRVSLRLMLDRHKAKMSDLGGKNPLSGRKLKGQQRAPRSLTKEVLPEVAGEIRAIHSEDQDKLSPRTLARHYAKHGAGTVARFGAKLAARGRRRDAERAATTMAESRKYQLIVEKSNRLAKAQQKQKVKKVLRKKEAAER